MASQLEFDTVLHVLDKHLSPACSVLDLTDGTYTPHLTRRGFRVSPASDATRLDLLSDKNFRAVLCFGPYCSQSSRDRRRRCLLECRRVVADGGFVAISYLNRAFAVPADGAHLTSPDEVESEVRSCGFRVAEHVGVDGVYDDSTGTPEELGAEAYQEFLWNHLRTCGQPAARGHSRHGLVVLQKA